MFSGPKPLVLSTSSSPPRRPLGVFPVDLLAAGLDDVEVEVGLGVPDQGELGVADLDLDAPDVLAPLAEPGQAEAVALARPRVVRSIPPPPLGVSAPCRSASASSSSGGFRSSG